MREGVCGDVEVPVSGWLGRGYDGSCVRSVLPPSTPTLRDGVECFEGTDGGGDGVGRDTVLWEAFLEPPRVPSFFGFFCRRGESESD